MIWCVQYVLYEFLSSFDNQPFEELCGWIKAQRNPSVKCDIFVHRTNNTKNYTQYNNTMSILKWNVCLILAAYHSVAARWLLLIHLDENKAPNLQCVSNTVLTLSRRRLETHHRCVCSVGPAIFAVITMIRCGWFWFGFYFVCFFFCLHFLNRVILTPSQKCGCNFCAKIPKILDQIKKNNLKKKDTSKKMQWKTHV